MARMTLDELTTQLAKLFGKDLRAVVLYGSAAAGEHVPKRSDYNVLVLVDTLSVEQLRAAGATVRAWQESGNPPPLVLTTQEWRSSADIFPMEYADVLERHRVLHGTLPLEGVSVASADLRLELEHEAMGGVLQLRRAIMATASDPARQLELLESAVSPMMVLFRSVLRLARVQPPSDSLALVREVAARAGFDAEPFVRVVGHVRGAGARLHKGDAAELLSAWLRGAERLVTYLDRYVAAT